MYSVPIKGKYMESTCIKPAHSLNRHSSCDSDTGGLTICDLRKLTSGKITLPLFLLMS